RVATDASVVPRHPYHVRQTPAYLEERYIDRVGPLAASRMGLCVPPRAADFLAWQRRTRDRLHQWLELNAARPCPPEPPVLERQEGPTCTREKWLIQTEPGVWVPGFLIRPRGMTGRRPLIYHLHGSGPGKDAYAGDEVASPVRMQLGHELEYMPYGLATA